MKMFINMAKFLCVWGVEFIMAEKANNLTPGMQQYMKIKEAHPDCVVLFRMGDFYETFYEDAKTCARELQITLTARGQGEKKAPLAGIPYHSVEPHIAKLVKRGYKVAIVEQTEDPRKAKGLVKRELVKIITPGTVVEDSILDHNKNNYLMTINTEKDKAGISLADISTGELMTTEVDSRNKLLAEVAKHNPAEIILPLSLENSELAQNLAEQNYLVNTYDDRYFWHQSAYKTLQESFGVLNLVGFGIEERPLSISSTGALLNYLKFTQKNDLQYIDNIHYYSTEEHMLLDTITQRNLELLKTINGDQQTGTLLNTIDKTTTSMGARQLKKHLLKPLLNTGEINKRLDAVEELNNETITRQELKFYLEKVFDVERLITRVLYGNANARDMIGLKNSLANMPEVKRLLSDSKAILLQELNEEHNVQEVVNLIEKAVIEEPPATIRDGNIIKSGFNESLDNLRDITRNSKTWIAELEEKEKQRTGIKSLKIKFNKVFGYFIEITKPNLHLVPQDYIRKQTQVNSERFITPELKEKEDAILNSEEKIIALEQELFKNLQKNVAGYATQIKKIARNLAELDVLLSFSAVSVQNNYCRPILHDNFSLKLKESRHPVIESFEESFVSNDCIMDESNQTMIITGPNMAGKSTYMRQVALAVLMAQIGCFVPASSAELPVVDRIFTRIGARDDLSSGQSTFMVEMSETARILNNATSKSLIILDEIGRGTSTYDGVSLAWSVAEHIHNNIGAKTLFATHYHQLNKLAEKYEGVGNYNITVHEEGHKIVFLRKIVRGGTNKSYGIQVAKLAGLPEEVIRNAKKVMQQLEEKDEVGKRITPVERNKSGNEEATKKTVPAKSEQKSLTELF